MISASSDPGCVGYLGERGCLTRKPCLRLPGPDLRSKRGGGARCSPESTNASWRRGSHRSGGRRRGLEQSSSAFGPPAPPLTKVRDAWVRPQIAPGCLALFCLPGSKSPCPPRSAAVRSSLAPRPGPLTDGIMEEKVDSSTAPDGSCLVSAQETEKWMEEAMRMVRKPAGG